jgi:hypothetical protein
MIHMLDDPDSTTSDHQVGVAGVTSHDDLTQEGSGVGADVTVGTSGGAR